MPYTIQDLGKAKKAQHPGVYDDISDYDLGYAIKAKNPGSYDDFVDAAPVQPDKQFLLEQHQKNLAESNPSMLQKAGKLASGTIQGTADTLWNIPKALYEQGDAVSEDILNLLAPRNLSDIPKNLTMPNTGKLLEGLIGSVGTAAGNLGAIAEDPNMPASQYEKVGKEVIGPVVGTLLGGKAIGTAVSAVKAIPKLTAKATVREYNSLIKPTMADQNFGKTPGAGLAKEGVAGWSWDAILEDLNNKLTKRSEGVKKTLELPSNIKKPVDLNPTLRSIDERISDATARNNQGLVTGLQEFRDSLTNIIERDVETGKLSKGAGKPMFVNPVKATEIKDWIGEKSTWTENAVEKGVNEGKIAAYRTLNYSIDKAVPGTFKANSHIADLISAKHAIERRTTVTQRQSIIPYVSGAATGGVVGGIVGSLTSASMGAESAAAAIILKQLLGSVGGKSYIAKILGKLAPKSVEELTKYGKMGDYVAKTYLEEVGMPDVPKVDFVNKGTDIFGVKASGSKTDYDLYGGVKTKTKVPPKTESIPRKGFSGVVPDEINPSEWSYLPPLEKIKSLDALMGDPYTLSTEGLANLVDLMKVENNAMVRSKIESFVNKYMAGIKKTASKTEVERKKFSGKVADTSSMTDWNLSPERNKPEPAPASEQFY